MSKIKYTCKNCGWMIAIIEEWADMQPKRCMNKRCNTSFITSPTDLIVELPKKEEPKEEAPIKQKKYSKKEE